MCNLVDTVPSPGTRADIGLCHRHIWVRPTLGQQQGGSAMDADFVKLEHIMGERVVDPHGHRIGRVTQVALEPQTFRAMWLVLKTSRFGRRPRLVPIESAVDEGGAISVPLGNAGR
jgi:sporulation protein YlmC with PRC-barrel domain